MSEAAIKANSEMKTGIKIMWIAQVRDRPREWEILVCYHRILSACHCTVSSSGVYMVRSNDCIFCWAEFFTAQHARKKNVFISLFPVLFILVTLFAYAERWQRCAFVTSVFDFSVFSVIFCGSFFYSFTKVYAKLSALKRKLLYT